MGLDVSDSRLLEHPPLAVRKRNAGDAGFRDRRCQNDSAHPATW